MSFYIRIVPGSGYQLWDITAATAECVHGIDPAALTRVVNAASGEDIFDELKKQNADLFDANGNSELTRLEMAPGHYYPRMARPLPPSVEGALGWYPAFHAEQNFIAEARGQLVTLSRQLESICRTVQPNSANMSVFGHEIRNLLILACTEAENYWVGALKKNGVVKDRYMTTDYVKLAEALYLTGYTVKLSKAPWLAEIRPFGQWHVGGSPTQDIPWYNAYNAVKHNREASFDQATLQFAFEAVAACVILLVAQFGLAALNDELYSTYRVSLQGRWPLEKAYVNPLPGAGNWTAIDFPFP